MNERTLELHYQRGPGDGCGQAVRAAVRYRDTTVSVRLMVDLSADACAAIAEPATFTVRLDEPLAGREVVDPFDL